MKFSPSSLAKNRKLLVYFKLLIMEIIAYVNIAMLTTIGLVHYYWGFGGQLGFMASLPEEHGEKIFIPDKKQILTVATLLSLLSLVHLCYIGILIVPYCVLIGKYGVLALAGIFGLRAIGDFKYVGFSKRVKDGLFSKNDTRIFSPICLLISASNIFLFYYR